MSGIGIGVLLITPEKEMIPYSLKLGFQCTHNMAEYEALIQGLKILQNFNVKRVHAFGDSLLVVSQVNTEWQVKDSKIDSLSEDRPSSCGQLRRISAQSYQKRAQSDSRWLSQLGLHFILQRQ